MIQPRKLRDGRSEWDYAERGEKRTRLLQPRKVLANQPMWLLMVALWRVSRGASKAREQSSGLGRMR